MDAVTKTIYNLELSLLKSEVRSSASALDAVLAEDFVEFGTSGKKYTKKDVLERLPKELEKFEYVVSDFSVEAPSENIAIATYKTELKIGTEKVKSQRSSHWRREDDVWRMFFHKGTLI